MTSNIASDRLAAVVNNNNAGNFELFKSWRPQYTLLNMVVLVTTAKHPINIPWLKLPKVFQQCLGHKWLRCPVSNSHKAADLWLTGGHGITHLPLWKLGLNTRITHLPIWKLGLNTRRGPPYHIETETRWLPFSRGHFQMHFLEWKFINFNWDFTEVCF